MLLLIRISISVLTSQTGADEIGCIESLTGNKAENIGHVVVEAAIDEIGLGEHTVRMIAKKRRRHRILPCDRTA